MGSSKWDPVYQGIISWFVLYFSGPGLFLISYIFFDGKTMFFEFLDAKPYRIIRKSSQTVISRPEVCQIYEKVEIRGQEIHVNPQESTGTQKNLSFPGMV